MTFVPTVAGRTASGDTSVTGNTVAMTLGVRPNDIGLADGAALLRGTVSIVENLGELVMTYFDIGGTEALIVKPPGTSPIKAGDVIALSADPARLHVFDAEGPAIR